MRLTIDGAAHTFIPIKSFRDAHKLPPEFGVALFEPKDYSGLGRIDQAGAELNGVRTAVLAAIPASLWPQQWLTFIPELTRLFTDQLYAINNKVKLHDVEIEFAAAGFADVCQAVVYALLRTRGDMPPFEAIYGDWLDQTVRVSQTVHRYGDWQVQIVTHAYGRAGLIVQTDAETVYVQDAALGCPAEGYMAALLADVAARIVNASR
ncbi:MAG: hypothetical protein GC204_17095 [Chloroflexi bacterium]|nr:hypothetical protein [Chloroflexota bacterium]